MNKRSLTLASIALLLGGALTVYAGTTTISTDITNTVQYIQKLILTDNGGSDGTTGVVIDGVNAKIGVGTDNPQAKLEVEDSGYAGIRVEGGSAAHLDLVDTGADVDQKRMLLRSESGKTKFFSLNDDGSVNNASILVMEHDGNLGIGTSSPTSTLSLGTNSTISTATADGSDTDVLKLAGGGLASSSRGATIQLYGNESSNPGELIFSAGNDGTGDDIKFYTRGSQKAIIKGDGKIGIGASFPTEKLQVDGNILSKSSQNIAYDATATDGQKDAYGLVAENGVVAMNSFAQLLIKPRSTDGAVARIVGVDEGSNSTSLRFITALGGSPSERMTIGSNGNLGIGTTTPQAGFDYVGTNGFALFSSSENDVTNKDLRLGTRHYQNAEIPFYGMFLRSSSTQNILSLGGGTSAGNAATDILFSTAENTTTAMGSEKMRIDGNGNVGIGTTSPGAPLHAFKNGTAGAQTIVATLGSDTSNRPVLQFSESSSADITAGMSIEYNGDAAVNKMHINDVTGAPVATFQTNGNVGIGTSTPTDKLDLFSSTHNQRLLRISHPTSPTQAAGFLGFSSDGTTDSNVVTLGVQYSAIYYDVLNIQRSTRNVGIGLSNPSRKLSVNGDAGGTSAWNNDSDLRFKTNIKPLDSALENILKLRAVSFDWRQDEFPEKNWEEGTQIGVIAQEIEKIYPELVSTDEEGYKSVSYATFTPILIEAIKELHQQKIATENKYEELEQQLQIQQQQIDLLSQEIQALQQRSE